MTMRGRDDPDDPTEGATRGPFAPGPARQVPPGTNAELTPPPFASPPTSETFEEATFTADPDRAPPASDAPEEPAGTTDREIGSDEGIGIQGPPRPGQVLFGRYRVEALLGEGGMGSVWLVRHLELDTLRALKLIVSGIAFEPQARARFKREARVMARLSHPNAVVVHDARMAVDAAFIEMEYIRGQSLNKQLRSGIPMPLDWTTRILEQLCDVLQEAHSRKIVHRDLKPANLMLVEGRPPGKEFLKVLDFGIAKILEADAGAADVHTHTGVFMGSAPYSSPEQASGGEVDGRSDLYSVGILLYELLTGTRPFSGPIHRLIHDHIFAPPPPFSERNASAVVPPGIERAVLRCLAKDPAARPPSAHALFEEFRRALPGESYRTTLGDVSPMETVPPPLLRPGMSSPLERLAHAPQEAIAWPETNADRPSVRGTLSTEDQLFVPYQGVSAPATEGPFVDVPRLPEAHEPTASDPTTDIDRDWSTDPALRAKPGPGSRRRRAWWPWLAALGLLLAVSGLAAGYFLTSPRASRVRWPEGYQPFDPRDLEDNLPRALVRTRDGVRFLRIAGGRFDMGNNFDKGEPDDDDQPAHPVELSDYYLQETEVTNAEMVAYFRAKGIEKAARPRLWQAACDTIEKEGQDLGLYPAVGISHELAEQYARWVGGALPSEAQWEFAARSRGRKIANVWGDEEFPDLAEKRAHLDNVGVIGTIPTAVVKRYPKDRTAQGVFDLTGNVREWCHDVWSPYEASRTPLRDPEGPPPSSVARPDYVIRGGSFLVWRDKVRTTRPRHNDPGETGAPALQDGAASDLGFRVVLEWPRDQRPLPGNPLPASSRDQR